MMNDGQKFAHEDRWTWLRVFYYEDCKDNLILDGVWPAVSAPAPGEAKPDVFFKRDWIGGPNILIGMKKNSQSSDGQTTGRVAQIERYLEKHPSRKQLSQSEFESLTMPYGDWELQQQSLKMELRPDNSVVVDAAEPNSPIVNDGDLKQALRKFLCESSSIVVDWLNLVRDGQCERQHIALTALVSLIWLAEPKKLRSHMKCWRRYRAC